MLISDSRRETEVEDCGEHFYGPGVVVVYTTFAYDQNLNHMSKSTPREARICSLAVCLRRKGK